MTLIMIFIKLNKHSCCCCVAALDPFPTVRDPQIHRPAVGSALTLRCDPPPSYPPGTVYWGETKNGPKLRPIENTDRVSLDYEGTFTFYLFIYLFIMEVI